MKTERIDIRVSPETKEEWCGKAKEKGLSLTEYIVERVEGVHTDNVHTGKKEPPIVHTDNKERDKAVAEAIEKVEGIKSSKFRSYFKDNKLNKG